MPAEQVLRRADVHHGQCIARRAHGAGDARIAQLQSRLQLQRAGFGAESPASTKSPAPPIITASRMARAFGRCPGTGGSLPSAQIVLYPATDDHPFHNARIDESVGVLAGTHIYLEFRVS